MCFQMEGVGCLGFLSSGALEVFHMHAVASVWRPSRVHYDGRVKGQYDQTHWET
jgi:hypothetical protein